MKKTTTSTGNRRRAAYLAALFLLCTALCGCASPASAPEAVGRAQGAAQGAASAPESAQPPENDESAEHAESAESASTASSADGAVQTTASFSAADVPVFVPNDSGLTQYTLAGETADGAAIMALMAEKGAFPADVTLLALDEADGTVRLQFSGALQTHLDASPSAAVLEAIAKTFRAFYEAGNKPVETLEIYADGAPVTVGGAAIDCTALMYGELPVSGVVDAP